MSAPISGAGRYVGQRIQRKEDLRLLTGHGAFVDDIPSSGALHAAFVRSQVARGRIVSLDLEAARALPGVRAVLAAKDLGELNAVMTNLMLGKLTGVQTRPLSEDYVSYVGDPVAIVLADDRYIAEDAAGLVWLEVEEEDPVLTNSDAQEGARVHAALESNLALQIGTPPSEVIDGIFATANHVTTHSVTHQRIAQSTMEPRGVLSTPGGTGELTVHIGCQSVHIAAAAIAVTFNLPEAHVRVIAKDVGGGFGLKANPWREEIAAIAASLCLRRPVKWIEDRFEALTSSNATREQEITIRIAFDGEAKIQAFDVDYHANNGAYPHMVDAGMPVMMFLTGPYRVPVYRFAGRAWHTNTVGLGGYRAPWAIESLVRETAIDKAARELGLTPVEIRRRNLLTDADMPTASPLGIPITDITPIPCLEKLLEKLDVARFREEQMAARIAGRYLGLGIAIYIEPTAMTGTYPLFSDGAEIRIDRRGKVVASLSTASQGHGIETTHAQIIAQELGVRIEDVTILQDDSARSPFGPGAAGSRQAVIAGAACIKASRILVDKIKAIAAHALNADPESITLSDGMVHVAGAEAMSRPLTEIADLAYGAIQRLPHGMEAGLEARYRHTPEGFTTHATAAHAAIVEVDRNTGFVDIKRWISSEDCGVVINPAIVEGQIAGGLAQAIGCVLLEEYTIDKRGNPTAVTFKDYLLPAISDIPVFEYTHICTPAQGEGGFRGVGEGGIIIGAPTLVNAIADAMVPFGPLPESLPLTPPKLFALMAQSAT